MRPPNPLGLLALAAVLSALALPAKAYDDTLYPDWSGQWLRLGGLTNQATWDPDRPGGLKQEPPLIPEYQSIFEENVADQAAGGQGTDPGYLCHPHGMPRLMLAVQPMQIIVMPETTYIANEIFSALRRVYTDGREWPATLKPSFHGYSIGRWEDSDQDGRYDTLVIETRGMRGPRSFDAGGTPLHSDNSTITFERIYSDRANPNVLYNEVTTLDHALTRPWTVKRSYRRNPTKQPVWGEYACHEANHHLVIGKENYVLSWDGLLMPARKGQRPPDLRHFDGSQAQQ
jgi:hypothetical protein